MPEGDDFLEAKNMDIVTFLEQMATQTDYDPTISAAIKNQSPEVQKAFLTNDAALLKAQLGSISPLTDRTTIVQL